MKKQYIAPHILCVDVESEGPLAQSFVNTDTGTSVDISGAGSQDEGYAEKRGNSSFRDEYGSNW